MRRTKIGDVFEIKLNDFNRYIQYLGKDRSYLDGDIVRCFRFKGHSSPQELATSLLPSGILFVCHTYIGVGSKLGVWSYVGNVPLENDFAMPVFRSTKDSGAETKVSENWYIWKPNEEFRFIGRMTKEFEDLPFGAILQPHYVKKWAKTGTDSIIRPG